MKSIYRRHLAGGMNSPIYYQPSLLLQHQDTYFEDFICSEQAEGSSYMLRTVGLRHCEPDYRLERKVSSRYAIYYVFSGIGYADGIRVGRGMWFFSTGSSCMSFSAVSLTPACMPG